MNNHSIRKFIITGVVVLSLVALASLSMDKKGEDMAYYPIEQTSNVFAAFDSTTVGVPDGDDPLDTTIPDCITHISNSYPDTGPGQCTVTTCEGTVLTGPGLEDPGCGINGNWDDTNDSQEACFANRCLGSIDDSTNRPSKEEVIGLYESLLQNLAPGSSDPLVYVIEFELQKRGFFPLTPDTTFGYRTRDGIKLFQQKNNLPATGILDRATLSRLLFQ